MVAGTTFFFFTLRDDKHTLPVLVKVGNHHVEDRLIQESVCLNCFCVCVCVQDSKLWWSQCVGVGQSVCVTALRVCVLRAWRGNNILCVTDCSNIHTEYTLTQQQTHTEFTQPIAHTPADEAQADTPLLTDHEEAEPEMNPVQSAVRMKHSRVISYQVGGL